MNNKLQDREYILAYLKNHPTCPVSAIIQESGTERLRVYPILFEFCQERIIRVVEESEWGAPVRVELTQET